MLALALACSGGGEKGPGGSGPAPASGKEPPHLRATDFGIYERAGGRDKQLLSLKQGTYVTALSLSPDGKRLAYIFQPEAKATPSGEIDFGADLFTMNRDGSDRREILRHSRNGEFLTAPMWLPDGRTMYFVVRGRDREGLPDFRLESIDLPTGQRKRVIEDAVDAAISDDGKTIAYVNFDPLSTEGESLRILEVGSSSDNVIVPPDLGLVLIGSPNFSPDGKHIVFAASSLFFRRPGALPGKVSAAMHPTLQDVWLVDRDGSNLKRVAEIVENQPSVDWSADGKSIYALGGQAFWKIDVASGEVTELGPGEPNGVMELLPVP